MILNNTLLAYNILHFFFCVAESKPPYLELEAFLRQYGHIPVLFVFYYFVRSFHIRFSSPEFMI